MSPITFALRRPWTVMVAVLAVVLTCAVALRPKGVDQTLQKWGIELPLQTMKVDIFPALNLPVIYVCQPYGGMDPAQMEGLLTNYYEYHFLYISNIHHVESRNIQGMALMKLTFHSGTDMAQAMAETINYVIQSFIGAIMAMGVGMLPMALGMGESGAQSAPLGRAVIGGLASATLATLLILPAVFALVQRSGVTKSASLDPLDAGSPQYSPEAAGLLTAGGTSHA